MCLCHISWTTIALNSISNFSASGLHIIEVKFGNKKLQNHLIFKLIYHFVSDMPHLHKRQEYACA